jgi:hypothetical protein
MLVEEWRPVVGAEGSYEVSSLGRVRSVPRQAGKRYISSTVLATRAGKSGYRRVNMSVGGEHRTRMVHQLVAEAFHGTCPAGMVVDHIDRDKFNNRADNLRYLPFLENSRKLTPATVHRIRQLRSEGWSQQRIASEVGCGQSAVSTITRRMTWAEIGT